MLLGDALWGRYYPKVAQAEVLKHSSGTSDILRTLGLAVTSSGIGIIPVIFKNALGVFFFELKTFPPHFNYFILQGEDATQSGSEAG